jgi:hypothetical protein
VGKIEMEKRKEKIPLKNILKKKNTAESTENTGNVVMKNELNDITNPALSTPNAVNVSTHLI